MNDKQSTRWWIGASDRKEESKWVWESDGAQAKSLEGFWASGEPNNGKGSGQHFAVFTGPELDDFKEFSDEFSVVSVKPICQF